MSFKSFRLAKEIMAQIEAMEYKEPTPIQREAIPVVMKGRDVMGLAQTGTGKTAAFVLPLLQSLMKGKQGQLRVLIVAPTRELAEQINDNIRILGKKTGLRSLAVYGGVKANPQIKALKRGVDLLVACPGRLIDLIGQGFVDLTRLRTLVLDEADHMFDMGFLPDIRRILRFVPQKRQTLLFSATMPPDIQHLADKILSKPRHIEIEFTSPLDNISHVLYPVEQKRKSTLLMKILKDMDTRSILIFTRTKHRAKKLGRQLEQWGYSAVSLQGNLSQNRRQAALDGFRDGSFRIMVATDIAARGIDVTKISHVINFDMPDTADAYTHRIGRTGRASRKGEAITFVTSEDKRDIRLLERKMGVNLEYKQIQGFDFEEMRGEDRSRERRNYGHGSRSGRPSGQRNRSRVRN